MNILRCRGILLAVVCVIAPPAHATLDPIYQDGFERYFGFRIQSPAMTIPAGQDATLCYYLRTPNSQALGVRRWVSHKGPGIHHAILYATSTEMQPAGTLAGCTLGSSPLPTWLYAAHDVDEDLVFPQDDGSGARIALTVGAAQFVVLQMYTWNTTDQPLTSSVSIEAQALDPAASYTASASYVAQTNEIEIGPGAIGSSVSHTCAVPAGAKFWWLSTRTHHRAVDASISDGSTVLVDSTDWEHPVALDIAAPPFHVFAGSMKTSCVYNNPDSQTIHAGSSEANNEECIGVGYFFPATAGLNCFNGIGPF